MAADEQSMPFLKHLASSDAEVRTSALDTLRTFLSASTASRALTSLDSLKLWKGLFYSVWMCDRPVPQQNLCAELAKIVSILPDEAVVPWLRGFWETMSREWTNIDVLRMEKFLLLVRRVFGASLGWVKDKKWKGSRADTMVALLEEWPFEKSGDLSKVPVGLRLHAIDIWVDELERLDVLKEDSTPKAQEFLQRIREIVQLHVKSACKPVRAKAAESLEDERLPWNEPEEQEGAESKEDGGNGQGNDWDGFDD